MIAANLKPQTDAWCTPPANPSIAPGEAHVWRIDLEFPDADIDRKFKLLSADERDRANRFIFKKDRNRYIAARSALRRTLGRYLQADPAELKFTYASHGKPSLHSACNPQDLRFNLSHSGGIALIALAVATEVGIDVERIRENFSCLEIAREFFTAAEYEHICATDPALRNEVFFSYWTHKEAYIKAIGEGLSFPLNQFEVSLQAGVRVKSLNSGVGVADYSLHSIAPCTGYVGALAVAGDRASILMWRG